MPIRWIIGRAGTGKTAACAREIRNLLARDPFGPPLLWIVPEQATFMAERLLLTGNVPAAQAPPHAHPTSPGLFDSSPAPHPSAPHGSFRAHVLSFRRLALLIARDTGPLAQSSAASLPASAKPLDDIARIVLLEEIVRQNRARLSVFASVADRPGFIRKLDATLAELRQHGHTAETLRILLDTGTLDAAMHRKLADLALLLDGWNRTLSAPLAGILDFQQVMQIAIDRMGHSPLVAGQSHGPNRTAPAHVWVDAVSAMSGLEMRLLSALGRHAQQITITLLADPDAPEFADMRRQTPTTDALQPDGLFARTQRLHRRLTDIFRQQRVPITQTIALRRQFRFADPALQKIEAELFTDLQQPPPRRTKSAATPKPAPPSPLISPRDTSAAVELWECSDPETEVRIIAQAIRDLVTPSDSDLTRPTASAPLRYRQIGIILPDTEGYSDALRRVLTEHAIPHFIDALRTLAHHPLVELLRSIVAIAHSHWDREDLLLYLKTRLAGISEDQTAIVENYIIEHGISHVPWSEPWTWIAPNVTEENAPAHVPASARDRLQQANLVRAKLWHDLAPWWALAQASDAPAPPDPSPPGTRDGAAWVRGIRSLLTTLNVEQTLLSWQQAARAAGDIESALLHEQAWREIEQLLSVLENILANKPRTLAEFQRLLSTALESLTLALIPPTVDQVLVSSVTRSRVPDLDIVFLVGAVEGQFPKIVEEDPILSDAQRAAFNTAAEPIGDGSDRQLLEMPFFDYVAFTRAGRRLIVSFPLADRRGRALGPSRYVARLRELLGPQVHQQRFDPASRTEIQRISTLEDLLAAAAAWAHRQTQSPPAPSSPEIDTPMRALYHWLATSTDPRIQEAMKLVWQSVRPRPQPRLALDLARLFYPPQIPLRTSVSQLEKFAACPLQYFMSYTLGLHLREEFALDAMNLGTFYHSILERVYRRILAGDLPWPDCEISTLRALLEQEVDAAAEALHAELARRTPGYQRMRARTKRTLGIVLEADRRRACAGSMRPLDVEISFGYSGTPQPPQPSTPPRKAP